ncbi:MAG: 6-carboxytetrahydropterin synthase [Candidatus Marinimicrobia bacterium]|nr:6-carboxytetrahydropterin synthase [Candidatus Neomarinimicrobiota bacterium]
MAHRLTFHEGLCRNIHGHSYMLEIYIEGENDKNGMIMDYADLKELVKNSIIEQLDHCIAIYEKDELLIGKLPQSLKQFIFPFETTAENLVKWILNELNKIDNRIRKAELWETRNSKATYTL